MRRGLGSEIHLYASSDLLLIWRKPLLFSKVVIEEQKDVVLTVSTSVSSDSHLFGKTRVLFYLPKCSHLLALFTFSRFFRRDSIFFSAHSFWIGSWSLQCPSPAGSIKWVKHPNKGSFPIWLKVTVLPRVSIIHTFASFSNEVAINWPYIVKLFCVTLNGLCS